MQCCFIFWVLGPKIYCKLETIWSEYFSSISGYCSYYVELANILIDYRLFWEWIFVLLLYVLEILKVWELVHTNHRQLDWKHWVLVLFPKIVMIHFKCIVKWPNNTMDKQPRDGFVLCSKYSSIKEFNSYVQSDSNCNTACIRLALPILGYCIWMLRNTARVFWFSMMKLSRCKVEVLTLNRVRIWSLIVFLHFYAADFDPPSI